MKLLTATIDKLCVYGTKKVLVQHDNENDLLPLLAALQFCYFSEDYRQDDMQYSNPPIFDKKSIMNFLGINFPQLGDYNSVADVSIKIGKPKKVIGNALHNLAIIIQDCLHIQWCIQKTSKKNALWQFKTLYENHFVLHVVELVRYLEYKKIEQ